MAAIFSVALKPKRAVEISGRLQGFAEIWEMKIRQMDSGNE